MFISYFQSKILGDSICARCLEKSQESEKKEESDGGGMEIESRDNGFLEESLQGGKPATETTSKNEQNNNIDKDLHNTTVEKMSFEDLDRGQSDTDKMDNDNSNCWDDDSVETEGEETVRDGKPNEESDAIINETNNKTADRVDGEYEAEEEDWEWEDSDDYEYEYYEIDEEDQYKVQTFDESFSIAI